MACSIWLRVLWAWLNGVSAAPARPVNAEVEKLKGYYRKATLDVTAAVALVAKYQAAIERLDMSVRMMPDRPLTGVRALLVDDMERAQADLMIANAVFNHVEEMLAEHGLAPKPLQGDFPIEALKTTQPSFEPAPSSAAAGAAT